MDSFVERSANGSLSGESRCAFVVCASIKELHADGHGGDAAQIV